MYIKLNNKKYNKRNKVLIFDKMKQQNKIWQLYY